MNPEIQTLEELTAACHSFVKEAPHQFKPRVAAWGLVKAGKSSLLNMLSGHVEREFFKTGAVRTTLLNQELEMARYLLLDTPGLGIQQVDDEQAATGLQAADVILFVHAPPGELDREEIELLAQVKAAFAEQTEQRLVLVLSQLDKDQDGALERIRQRVLEQLREQLAIQPQCFLISNSRYRKGAAKGQQKLIEHSGIPRLGAHLDELSLAISDQLETVRNRRRAERRAELQTALAQAIAAERQQLSRLLQPYISRVRDFNQRMAALRQGFASRSAEIAATQKKLSSLQA